MDWILLLEWVIKGFALVMILLTGFAYLTLFERRILAFMQVRIGPNRAGPQGILQPIADAVKLIFKEELTPAKSEKFLFLLAPIVTVVPAVVIAAVIPWGTQFEAFGRTITLYVADINIGVLYITAIASIAVYGIVLAGWSSNNKYAMMGGLRSSAQMISYELPLGLSFVLVTLMAGSMRPVDIVEAQRGWWFGLMQPVGALLFLISILAEVNRAPFDMPEAEQELTAGYHAEYSGMKFALFFMAEYIKMIAVSAIMVMLFLGGYRELPGLQNTWFSVDQTWWLGPIYMFLKVLAMLFVMVWIRATLPRIRYDRLMSFGWKVMLPLSLALIVITALGLVLQPMWALAPYILTPVLSLAAFGLTVLLLQNSLARRQHA
ncbi:MAG: NADH-quinone oxidoreductase subunit NuoH [Anaerolineae bacterium CG_4_9_14_3_um_filter_57_17]|nr:NADH-quinone oxidoreductase subunit NuoH [bacterium]NCT22194.1 NADH-quinone oxidoreductase subunit NuoH [bacterium]OIO84474.1 MAG: NADH-quinone oxidoreductase subunit H [Anaerolineae bacterium CG2_30_57_67]PJB66250.1 MAG: NADH-quinone oxidoreductase subunit NuoH [Anaerolineae bacterium CG_4_9_14_3_um_filter_57_17]